MLRNSSKLLLTTLMFVSVVACESRSTLNPPAKMSSHSPRDHASSQALMDVALKINKPISVQELKQLLGEPDHSHEIAQPLLVLSTFLEYELHIGTYIWKDGESIKLTKNPRLSCQFDRNLHLAGINLTEPVKAIGRDHLIPGTPAFEYNAEREKKKDKNH